MVVSKKSKFGDAMLEGCNLVASFSPGCCVFETESDGQPVFSWLALILTVKLRYWNSSLMTGRYIR